MSRKRRLTPGQWLVAAVGAVVIGITAFAAVLAIISDPDVQDSLANDVFEAGDAERVSDRIEQSGPVLFPDLAGGDRAIYLQHLSDGRWVALAAYAPAAGPDCPLDYDAETEQFRDTCTDATFPADGEGLTQYPVTVDDDGKLVVDLRRPAEQPEVAPPTSSPSSS